MLLPGEGEAQSRVPHPHLCESETSLGSGFCFSSWVSHKALRTGPARGLWRRSPGLWSVFLVPLVLCGGPVAARAVFSDRCDGHLVLVELH